ncbi:MAG: AAA family ATPase [Imperialibacter sp.]|uniref:AAA family ATPase n=1 Tax=Imperialibacter sp. TaxID=2038411 RepID=UPI003A84F1FE
MSSVKVENFGPIKKGYQENGGWLDVKKVTVFIGNQGSGKSTIAKVISTLTWLEKALHRGDVDGDHLSHNKFYELFRYQRIQNYFRDDTIIEYRGEAVDIYYSAANDWPIIEYKETQHFSVPKIMYIPAERNFLSVVKNAYGVKNLPDTLYTFAEELKKGQQSLNRELLPLPIGNIKFKYENETDASYLVGEGFNLNLLESSSGYQSLVPLYLVTKFLSDELNITEDRARERLTVEQSIRRNEEMAEVMQNKALSASEKTKKVDEILAKYINTCLINIVEEPEQNLFPSSQHQVLNSLLDFNNTKPGNRLIITTHSPYLINYLTLAVKAGLLDERVQNNLDKDKIYDIVPKKSTIRDPNDLAIYELDEHTGTIKKLESFNGLPSDENELNDRLGEANDLFAKLLEIQQSI